MKINQCAGSSTRRRVDGVEVDATIRTRRKTMISTQAFAKADLEIMHTQLCAQQEWRANEPAQKLMRWTTFVRALQQLATRAFPDQDVGAAFGRLLDHVHRNAVDT